MQFNSQLRSQKGSAIAALLGAITLVVVVAVLINLWRLSIREIDLIPFASDGCSAFPDGTLAHRNLWLNCCEAHDFAYWQGGTKPQRKAADDALSYCVAQVGEPEIAAIMLAGVRVGGSPYWPTSFRWGYGWRWPRWYAVLTPTEREKISRVNAR